MKKYKSSVLVLGNLLTIFCSRISKLFGNQLPQAEVYSEPCQTSKMERFGKKFSILDVWQGSE